MKRQQRPFRDRVSKLDATLGGMNLNPVDIPLAKAQAAPGQDEQPGRAGNPGRSEWQARGRATRTFGGGCLARGWSGRRSGLAGRGGLSGLSSPHPGQIHHLIHPTHLSGKVCNQLPLVITAQFAHQRDGAVANRHLNDCLCQSGNAVQFPNDSISQRFVPSLDLFILSRRLRTHRRLSRILMIDALVCRRGGPRCSCFVAGSGRGSEGLREQGGQLINLGIQRDGFVPLELPQC